MMKAYILLAALGVGLTVVACTPSPKYAGEQLYKENCTSCHGDSGRGEGPISDQLEAPAPDLTLIAQRNGGGFPIVDVMSTIDGYSRARIGDLVMPEFGQELQAGPLVFLDTGDGSKTPTPTRLFALAEYLRSIQR